LIVLTAMVNTPAGAQSGADVFDATGPPSQVAENSLLTKFPMSHYALDLHIPKVDAGVIDLPDVPKLTLFAITDIIWQATAYVTYLVIQLFTFAFSLDLLRGSEATNGKGALEPVSRAVQNFYNSTFGEPFLIAAIICAGLWGINKALLQRRTMDALQGFATSLVFAVIAMWFVFSPAGSVGFISDKSNELSSAFLSVSSSGEVVGAERAKTDASDRLFEAHVLNPWLSLNFGGLIHCVTTASFEKATKGDPEEIDDTLVSTNVYPRGGPDRKGRARRCYNNKNYAGAYLTYEQGDKKRSGESGDDDKSGYVAINEGDDKKYPDALPEEYKVPLDAGDAAAVSMQESGGLTQRLGTALVIGLGNLGMILLIAALSIAVVLAQILALLLLLFAPAALVIGIFPGRGHEFFRTWLIKLLTALFRKAIYSFVLAVLLAAAAALTAASADLGWLMSFGLQATFYWMVFLYRKQILAAFTAATGGDNREESSRGASEMYYKGRMAVGGARAMWNAPGALATAAANAGRGTRDSAHNVGEDAGKVRDWVNSKRNRGEDEDGQGDSGQDPDDGPRRLDWSTDGDDTPTTTGPSPVPVPVTGGNGAGGGPTATPPPGGEDRRAQDGREGRPGRAGEGVPGAPGAAPPASSAPGAGGADADPQRAIEQASTGAPPPGLPPQSPATDRPPRRDGQSRPSAASRASAARRSADASIREAQDRIRDLERKRGRTAGEKQELDQLRDWLAKAKGDER
jgi:hypothetical protein